MKNTKATAAKKKRSGKRIIVISVCAFLAIVIAALVSVYAWYSNTALPVALKISEAAEAGDGVTVFKYVQPSDRRTVKLGMVLLGMDENDALKMALGTNKNPSVSVTEAKLLSYEETGDTAILQVLLSFSDGRMTNLTLNFVREDGVWYLSINEILSELFKFGK